MRRGEAAMRNQHPMLYVTIAVVVVIVIAVLVF